MKKLGFGLMRLPKIGEDIDIEQTKMVDHFMEAGFTYFDTAWAYAGSEDAIRQALVERYHAQVCETHHRLVHR
ncbi:MAG: aldo/keto reductase [Erysipelotrichaceae bacterium]|nr:aldo/keto reductase [Erysipelotrichaceae bacterium]